MEQVYSPGCALLIYKPHYADKVLDILNKERENITMHTICCKHEPKLNRGVQIINTCAGCDKRFGSLYDGISTVSLWEILAGMADFPFPDYGGLTMTVQDACPIRPKNRVHDAIRVLLQRMNINIIEARNNREHSICCGDSFYPELPVEKIHEKMRKRADEMPCQDVCVYCISCIKSMYIGEKKPRYILDLLFGEATERQTCDTVEWHKQLQKFIDEH